LSSCCIHAGRVLALLVFVVVRLAGSKLKWTEAGMLASLAAWVVFTGLMLAFVGSHDAAVAGAMTLFLAWRHQEKLPDLLAAT